METEEAKKKKTESRKFLVWLTWLIILIIDIVFDIIILAITKTLSEQCVTLTQTIVTYFFAISMMYLGVNVCQKVGLAITDKIMPKSEEDVASNTQ